MTCREAANLLPLFFDNELDPHLVRAVALHSAQCPTCERELREFGRIQQLLHTRVTAAIDTIDFAPFWSGIDARLPTVRARRWGGIRTWWTEMDRVWLVRGPALAAATAAALLALLYAGNVFDPSKPRASQIAALDGSALIHSLRTDFDSVAMYSDPDSSTTVLWVSDDASGTGN
jgi:anti-sigma factor RsiW